MATTTAARALTVEKAAIRFAEPFRITGYVFEAMPSVVARIGDGNLTGRGRTLAKVDAAYIVGLEARGLSPPHDAGALSYGFPRSEPITLPQGRDVRWHTWRSCGTASKMAEREVET